MAADHASLRVRSKELAAIAGDIRRFLEEQDKRLQVLDAKLRRRRG